MPDYEARDVKAGVEFAINHLKLSPEAADELRAAGRRHVSEMQHDGWVIRKSGYYYRPHRSGYTTNIDEAGRYTELEAKAEASIEPWHMSALKASDLYK